MKFKLIYFPIAVVLCGMFYYFSDKIPFFYYISVGIFLLISLVTIILFFIGIRNAFRK
jgi:hypothetical protein